MREKISTRDTRVPKGTLGVRMRKNDSIPFPNGRLGAFIQSIGTKTDGKLLYGENQAMPPGYWRYATDEEIAAFNDGAYGTWDMPWHKTSNVPIFNVGDKVKIVRSLDSHELQEFESVSNWVSEMNDSIHNGIIYTIAHVYKYEENSLKYCYVLDTDEGIMDKEDKTCTYEFPGACFQLVSENKPKRDLWAENEENARAINNEELIQKGDTVICCDVSDPKQGYVGAGWKLGKSFVVDVIKLATDPGYSERMCYFPKGFGGGGVYGVALTKALNSQVTANDDNSTLKKIGQNSMVEIADMNKNPVRPSRFKILEDVKEIDI